MCAAVAEGQGAPPDPTSEISRTKLAFLPGATLIALGVAVAACPSALPWVNPDRAPPEPWRLTLGYPLSEHNEPPVLVSTMMSTECPVYDEPWVTVALKLHVLAGADTAGTTVPLELGSAVDDVELAVVDEVELDPHAARPRPPIAPQASAARVSLIKRGV
jgi:hypothetical protein